MSDTRRRDAATATLGLAGVGGAGALRHAGLEQAYAGGKRPKMLQERRFFTRSKIPGRGKYLAGAGLAFVSVPPGAVGTARLLQHKEHTAKRDDRRHTLLEEGLGGVKDSLRQRVDTASNPAPAKLMAANYLGGAAVGSAAGGLTHLGLGRTKVPGSLRSGLAAAAGVAAGAATLPAQSKLIERASHGKYTATPTGVRRKRTAPKRPTSRATVVEGRPNHSTIHPHALREQMGPVDKMSPRQAANDLGAVAGAHWTVALSRAADRIEPYEARRARPVHRPFVDRHLPNAKRVGGKLVKTGRTKAAETVRAASYDISSLNDKDKLIREVASGQGSVRKREEYYGQHMTSGQKRARVMAAGAAPIVGDYAAAAAAAGMAPPELRAKTAAYQFGGSQGGQAAGSAAGAYGLVAAAKHPKVKQHVERANDAIDAGASAARTRLGLKPKTGPSMLTRVAEHKRTPSAVRGALKPLAKNPKVAAIGLLAGGMVGTQAGGYAGYGHALKLERERNAKTRSSNQNGRHGSVGKRDAATMSQADHRRQARKKKLQANISTFTGMTGTGALAALGGSKALRARGSVRRAGQLASYQTPLLTAGAGVGGLGSFNFASIQRKEAKAEEKGVAKGFLRMPHPSVAPPGVRRARSYRVSSFRQTRSGIPTRVKATLS